MNDSYFFKQLEFDPKRATGELFALGIDSVHYSGDYPAVFFKKVQRFGIQELKQLAEIQRKIWNYRKVLFLYVSSPTEIRIYNCSRQPFNFKADHIDIEQKLQEYEFDRCQKKDKEKIRELSHIFSATAIDSGSIWLHEENKYRDKIVLQRKVDKKLVESLLRTAKLLKKDKVSPKVVHSLLIRSLFIMYLEDRKATPEELYPVGYSSYLELLDDPDSAYKFYAEIEKHFKGNVFPVTPSEISQIKNHPHHLQRVKYCLYDGDPENIQQKLFDWRLFDFSIIQVEVLSGVYENFLNEFGSDEKKRSGAFYTPPSLVELILDHVLPIKEKEKDYNLKILDPACGSGIFLVEAYKRLVKRWKNSHPEKDFNFKELSDILQQSVFGVELNPHAIKVAAFSLYLAMLDFLEPKDVWLNDGEIFPFLIKDIESPDEREKKGNNLFRTNTIWENGEFEQHKYDLIIGNPPFSRQSIPQYAKDYIKKYDFASELVIPFIHKSARLTEKGKIALVFNCKILTNISDGYQKFRAWLFKDCYVEKVYNLSIFRKAPETFGGQLFSSAVGPIGVVFFSPKRVEKPESAIEYWEPKTFVKNDVIDGVITDSSDFKYLPREICQQPDTKIWKIAQWGTMADYFLVSMLEKKYTNFQTFISENRIDEGVGFQYLSDAKSKPKSNPFLERLPLIEANSIRRYYSDRKDFTNINRGLSNTRPKTQKFYLKLYDVDSMGKLPPVDKFRRLGTLDAYKSPHIVLKKGLIDGNKVCASFIEENCCFKDGVYGFFSKNADILKYLCAIFCSSYSHYYLFLTASSYAVEREQIMKDEYLNLPLCKPTERELKTLSDYFPLIKMKKNILDDDSGTERIEKEINDHLYKMMGLTNKEKILIEDTIKYLADLFHRGEKSISLRPISDKNPETESYSIMLCDEINNFLIGGDTKVTASYYYVMPNTPLCMAVLYFVKPSEVVPPQKRDSDKEFQDHLKKINKFTLEKYSRNIYVHKQIRYYDGNRIFIIKPNQKRFWTRSQAIDDAHSIITEIATQEV